MRINPRSSERFITGWGGGDLNAVVRRIEPFGQTEVSALGYRGAAGDVILDLPIHRPTLAYARTWL